MHEIQPAGDGNTLLGEEDADGLIPSHLTTRAELNQWEAVNIAQAVSRYSTGRRRNVLSTQFLRELHRQMFDRTWSWAGSFRRTDNNISSYQGIHRVLVLDDRKLEGIVSTMDVARALASGSIR